MYTYKGGRGRFETVGRGEAMDHRAGRSDAAISQGMPGVTRSGKGQRADSALEQSLWRGTALLRPWSLPRKTDFGLSPPEL